MNKSILAGLLLMFLASTAAQAEVAEDCPCLHLTKKQKIFIPSEQVPEGEDNYLAAENKKQPVNTVQVVLPARQPATVAKPVAKTILTPATATTPAPAPFTQKSEVAKEDKTTQKTLSSFYMGLSAGAHYGDVSSVSPKKTAHFTGRIFGGYELTDNLAIELGYFMVKPESQPTGSSVEHDVYNTTRNSSSLKARRHGLDILGVVKSTETVPGLYGKFGVAYERINFKDTLVSAVTGIPARDRTGSGHILHYGDKTINVLDNRSLEDNADFVLGVGYETKIMDHLFIRIDYSRYQPVKREIKMPVNFLSIGTKYQF